MASSATLIVGGESKVGRALAGHLRRSGQRVITTTRRVLRAAGQSADRDVLPLDLAGDVEGWPLPEPVTTAVLCAAVAKIDECERDPGAAVKVNVSGAVALARRLLER